ncbi:MAG TPA: hypothetical protein VII41_17525, partial [Steroidobacteraceae bacterium]
KGDSMPVNRQGRQAIGHDYRRGALAARHYSRGSFTQLPPFVRPAQILFAIRRRAMQQNWCQALSQQIFR